MNNWIHRNTESLIRAAFLIPILSVAAISISHVVSWYDLANPMSWAIYLSIAVEIAAMSAIAASSVKVKGFSVWFVFIIVTLIQFIGNIYFSYTEIDVTSNHFKDWSELTLPLFDSFSDTGDMVAQRRLLALLEGGLLPLISLTCLHFFIKYGDRDSKTSLIEEAIEEISEDTGLDQEEVLEKIEEVLEQTQADSIFKEQNEYNRPLSDTQVVFIDSISKDETESTLPKKQVELTPQDIEGRSFFSGSNIH
jgi:hypothetical protein